ncbi:phosphomethylpyrimidine kinase [Bordetella pertussis]|uniref:hydroxymethylpyrimidine kinase n=5 Tax=Bordetella pertussis TaxID=520 RepID=Q7W048_BORPE|nr:hydroxymethylpyrimidine/phosphomethylpyrimidine kinase [Bordetella pertussis]ETH38679.1 phosphomethylpyrimidine kinase [Bordetella pertussis H918]ETH43126.1 phosphomethylpyrimidine kinase [Bordetella pertussis H939]ETH45780.1 phosphomethylpyrimidine kinase [Bordetella pertussis H921]ETH73237.1 phosphomethylpyrimidine kinase [Bordetella pertussis STO1-CHLA-0011]ETH84594.1 phosphomethylpyrimidine kinase [Bordetella pertussis STO1-CHOC-0017]ETH86203.1 phosphomethylpyrimidine kinase [Bordetell
MRPDYPFFAVVPVLDSVTPPLVLIIGPVDPSGADGLPADAVSCARLGCHALAAVTALTVQDTAGIEEVHPVAPELLDDQARCLLEDMSVQAIKVGALLSAEAASVAAQIAADYSHVPLVLHLGQRTPLPQDAADQDDADDLLAATLELVLPQTDLVVVEHVRLAQWQADGSIDTSGAPSPAHALLAGGAQWALVLGSPARPGHQVNMLVGPEGQTSTWPWQAPPDRNGDTGGVAAIAAAAMLAQGMEMPRAVEQALAHAERTIAASFLPGMGRRLPNRVAQS